MEIVKKLFASASFKALLIAFFTYFLFFNVIFSDKYTVFWSSDMKQKFTPVRFYLHDSIVNNQRFPFWTEKIFSGFPIYADTENAYLHPLNVVFTVIFGPIYSYKLLHLLIYLLGSYGLFRLLKSKGVGYLGYFVSNTILFFSYFFINKQIHQSLILTLYTFPLSIYLVDSYFRGNCIKKLVLSVLVLVSAFYWGHLQVFIIYCVGLLLFATCFHLTKNNLKQFFGYFLSLFWFSFLAFLPQLIPSLRLNSVSTRSVSTENISSEQGSFNPLMISTLVYPDLFFDFDHYIGEEFDSEYSFVETYSYFGMVAGLIFAFSLLYIRDKKLGLFVLLSFFIYFLLSYSKFIPFFDLDYLFPFSLFRYWTRSVFLFLFAFAMLTGIFVDKLYKQEVDLRSHNFKYSLFFLFVPIFIILINLGNLQTKEIFDHFLENLQKSYNFRNFIKIAFFSFLAIALVFFGLLFKNKYIVKIFTLFVAAFLVLDLFIFSRDVIAARTDNIYDLAKAQISSNYNSKRIIAIQDYIENNESLYYDFWWPYGYSQFKEEKYDLAFKQAKIPKTGRPQKRYIYPSNYDFYQSIGVTAILENESKISLNDNEIDLLATDLPGKYIKKNEGDISFYVNSSEPQIVNSYIKNYYGWVLKVNNKNINSKGSDLFIKIPLEKGENLVTLKFIPFDFYFGIISAITGYTLTFIALRKFKNVRSTKINHKKILY